MNTSRTHIVALPYYDVGRCLGEFFAEAQGRAMTLRPEPTNDVDANAICAYDWQGRHVGYVASHDLLQAWQTLRGSGRHSLRGRICELNVEHKCVVFECKVETIGDVPDLYPKTPFLEWHYSGPVLKPTKEMVMLEYMMDEIDERLDEHDDWDNEGRDDFLKLTRRFCEVTKYDLSGDMDDFRRRLCLKMLAMGDTDLATLVEEIKLTYGHAGRESQGGDVLDYWMRVLSDSTVTKTLLKNRHQYDIDKVRKELHEFPESLYSEWFDNRDHFISKLLYMHIPRKVLWQLVSGIAFIEAMTGSQKVCVEDVTEVVESEESPVYLNMAKGQKIDLIRVLNVMFEQGRFKGKDGVKLTKKEFFTEMGRMLHIDLSNYDNDLSRAMSDGTKLEKHLRVFDEMKQKMEEIWNSR